MQTRVNYLQASFLSFLIHACLFLYLVGFFYSDKQVRPILSKAVNVNIIVEDIPAKKIEELAKTMPLLKEVKTITEKTNLVKNITEVPKISSQGSIMNLQDLINQESQVLDSNILENDINKYSSLIINLIEAAWIKPKNIQNNLICDIKIKINPRGRIVDISLINSSGNIRFDNSALQAVRRVETFSFFNEITKKTYEDVFKNIVISFNPS
ncbi:MAG: cell envelope integrity protein TolA [SAR86 cluster bacterium]|jgi:colicin import membrane protein|nr:cell envelope integrity protein TolA [SAR86 cluster bacterium]